MHDVELCELCYSGIVQGSDSDNGMICLIADDHEAVVKVTNKKTPDTETETETETESETTPTKKTTNNAEDRRRYKHRLLPDSYDDGSPCWNRLWCQKT